MFNDLNEKDLAAANAAMKPIIEELVQEWGKIGNEVMEAHHDELHDMFPEHAYKIARMTIMNALPSFITNCCLSVSPGMQMQLAATLTAEVLCNALKIDKGHVMHEHELIRSIMAAFGGPSDDDKTDDDDRGAAEH